MTDELLCAVCGRRKPHWPQVCDLCRKRLDHDLYELGWLYQLLPHAIEKMATGHGERVSGSREPPTPLNLDALDLTLPARVDLVSDPHGDQTGHAPVASVLASWAEDWSASMIGRTIGNTTVTALVASLRRALPVACAGHPGIAEFAQELRAMLGAVRAVLALQTGKTRLLKPCPSCSVAALVRGSGDEWVECKSCKRLWTMEELEITPVDFIAMAKRSQHDRAGT